MEEQLFEFHHQNAALCTSDFFFAPNYQRNNKSGGQKNLRCFPHCCGNHNASGFCGFGLMVKNKCTLPAKLKDFLVVYARFEEVDAVAANVSIEVGSKIDHSTILRGCKTPNNVLGEWLPGKIVENFDGSRDFTLYEINGSRQSWHYGWTSNRTANRLNYHHLKVYFFTKGHDASTMECIDIISSSKFQIKCSRKHPKKGKRAGLANEDYVLGRDLIENRSKKKRELPFTSSSAIVHESKVLQNHDDNVVVSKANFLNSNISSSCSTSHSNTNSFIYRSKVPDGSRILKDEETSSRNHLIGNLLSDSDPVFTRHLYYKQAADIGLLAFAVLNLDSKSFDSWEDNKFEFTYEDFSELLDSIYSEQFSTKSIENLFLGNDGITSGKKECGFKNQDNSSSDNIDNRSDIDVFSIIYSFGQYMSKTNIRNEGRKFFARKATAGSSILLLDEAYSEAVRCSHLYIEEFLAQYNVSLHQFLEIMINRGYIPEDKLPNYLKKRFENKSGSEPYGFYAFVSQMQQVYLNYTERVNSTLNQTISDSIILSMKNDTFRKINGAWERNDSLSKRNIVTDESLKHSLGHIAENVFKRISVRYTGKTFNLQSSTTFLPHSWAQYNLTGEPSYCDVTLSGVSTCLSGARFGDYQCQIDKEQQCISLKQYMWAPESSLKNCHSQKLFFLKDENTLIVKSCLYRNVTSAGLDRNLICSMDSKQRLNLKIDWSFESSFDFYYTRLN